MWPVLGVALLELEKSLDYPIVNDVILRVRV